MSCDKVTIYFLLSKTASLLTSHIFSASVVLVALETFKSIKRNKIQAQNFWINENLCLKFDVSFCTYSLQGWISDMGINGPTFVPKSGYFSLIWVKVCPQKLAFS